MHVYKFTEMKAAFHQNNHSITAISLGRYKRHHQKAQE